MKLFLVFYYFLISKNHITKKSSYLHFFQNQTYRLKNFFHLDSYWQINIENVINSHRIKSLFSVTNSNSINKKNLIKKW